jgi:hypothetical protein
MSFVPNGYLSVPRLVFFPGPLLAALMASCLAVFQCLHRRHASLILSLAANHEAILRTYVERQYDKVVTPARVFAPPELLDDDPQDQNQNQS